jgi:RNA polymerase sigma factor (sigma-70 family)
MQQLIPHLFRTEFRKISSVLCKHLGIEHIETAEDIASETFLAALETWSYKGIPENPTAWLYTVAKNKAKNYSKRDKLFANKVSPEIKRSATGRDEIDMSGENITDSQLQMLFTVCHPAIAVESQIGLALRILCGFGIDEIATALLSNKETISKRLTRAKEKLWQEKVPIEMPSSAAIKERLDTVLRTLYLLFAEGYYSESHDDILRKDLCLEAMRLNYLLVENEQTNSPSANALLSLMCFHASRFDARTNDKGDMILYNDQDETRWNKELVEKGIYFLHAASGGDAVSKYHIEAGIAFWHTHKEDSKEKWNTILQLYNRLLIIESPIAALNRTFALSKVYGNEKAIMEAEKLNLDNNHFYFTLLGELYKDIDTAKAKMHFEKAFSIAKTGPDRQMILEKIGRL